MSAQTKNKFGDINNTNPSEMRGVTCSSDAFGSRTMNPSLVNIAVTERANARTGKPAFFGQKEVVQQIQTHTYA